MGRPPQSDGRDTRRAILDIALEVFSVKGFFGTSLREIGRAVGIRESALYHYFASKEALFDAVLEDQLGGKVEMMTRFLEGPVDNAPAFLEKFGLKIIEQYSTLKQQRIHRLLMTDGMRLSREGKINYLDRMGGAVVVIVQLMERLIKAGHLREAPPEFLALEFIAPFLAWRHLRECNPDHPAVKSPETFVRWHVGQFVRGATKGPA
jgi:AcrR family transcriptional regulator